MAVYRELFNTDLSGTDAKYGTFLSMLTGFENNNEGEKYYNKRIRNRIIKLAEELSGAADDNTFLNTVCDFYKDAGVGCIGLFKAFRVGHDDNDRPVITPVISVEHKYLKDLIGYDIQKKKITDNTEAFLAGSKANNVLLFGDSGTGKSSCIKAILNEYYDDGLRMIEIYKHQFKDLSAIINQVKDRNYKFIIYMDDLSFEEFEIEYKFLKAVIEGGLEKDLTMYLYMRQATEDILSGKNILIKKKETTTFTQGIQWQRNFRFLHDSAYPYILARLTRNFLMK